MTQYQFIIAIFDLSSLLQLSTPFNFVILSKHFNLHPQVLYSNQYCPSFVSREILEGFCVLWLPDCTPHTSSSCQLSSQLHSAPVYYFCFSALHLLQLQTIIR